MRKRLPLVLVTVVLFGCSKKPTGPSPEATRKAQEALAPFKKRLKETLLGAMSQGPTSAVEACADQAAKIATEASHPGAKLGRSTNQPRNPANEVRGWQAEALAQFAATPQLEGATYARVLPSGGDGIRRTHHHPAGVPDLPRQECGRHVARGNPETLPARQGDRLRKRPAPGDLLGRDEPLNGSVLC